MINNVVVGVDIGGTNIRIATIDSDYNVSNFYTKRTKDIFVTANAVKDLSNFIQDYLNKNDLDVLAISIGFPSTIDSNREIVVSTPNIECLQNINIVQELSFIFDKPIFINRDVNCILLSDIDNSKLAVYNKIICGFYIGTGLGNTIMVDGKLLYGNRGVAGELGHVHVIDFHEKCGCGGHGCIELLAGGLALAKLQKDKYPNTPIENIFIDHLNDKYIQKYIENLAIAVTNEIVLLDPHLIIFGGGVIQMNGFPKNLFEDFIYKYARKPCEEGSLNIMYVEDSSFSGVKGAGIYAFKRLQDVNYF